MAPLSLLSLSAAGMVAGDFMEEEVFTVAVEDFMEAGSGAEDFTEGEDSEAAVFTVEVGSEVEWASAAGADFVAARFGAELAFAEEPSAAVFVEAFVAMASDAASVFAGAAGVGEDGVAGVGA